MSLKSVATEVASLLVLGVAVGISCYAVGHANGIEDSNGKVLAAQQLQQSERDRANAAVLALADLQNRFDIQKQIMLAAQAVARVALDELDATHQQLAAATAQRIANDRKAAHESPDCSDLEHLPVCPVLSRRLFGPAPQAKPAAGAATTQGH
ncbi:hypothetical protein [Frateuria sp. YIM B11624]|uniref:hypothetical protein n=1 Tax=Frateuria sp. YIM B11624 TaxID=3143185 RepID=UPI003C78BB0F